jgi:hypothetical protein
MGKIDKNSRGFAAVFWIAGTDGKCYTTDTYQNHVRRFSQRFPDIYKRL